MLNYQIKDSIVITKNDNFCDVCSIFIFFTPSNDTNKLNRIKKSVIDFTGGFQNEDF